MGATSLHDRVALVTGGTDGIGKEVARKLAERGIHVVIVGRDRDKGQAAEKEIQSSDGGVHFLSADLSRMDDTCRLADEIAERWGTLDYLVHGAGIVNGRRVLTPDGLESNFAVNYLSRFVLTNRLLPLLDRRGYLGSASRIVILGGAARSGKIYFDDVNLAKNFSVLRFVGQFCRANDVFTLELARRLGSSGLGQRVTITCLKIGVVKTNIRRTFPWWMRVLVPLADPILGQKPADVATSAVKLLLDAEFEGLTGALFLQIRKFRQLKPAATAADPQEGGRLWEFSEDLVTKLLASRLNGARR